MITEDIRAIYQKIENILSFNLTKFSQFPRNYFELLLIKPNYHFLWYKNFLQEKYQILMHEPFNPIFHRCPKNNVHFVNVLKR